MTGCRKNDTRLTSPLPCRTWTVRLLLAFLSASFALAFLALVPTSALAADADYTGTFYQYPNNPAYWTYVDSNFGVEVLVPSKASSYVEQETFGETILHVSIGETGPTLVFGRLPAPDGGADALQRRLLARWQLLLKDRTVTNDEAIKTSAGEDGHFVAVKGSRPDGRGGMIRLVVFTREKRAAYLLLLTDSDAYDVVTSQYWIRAVNSFGWN